MPRVLRILNRFNLGGPVYNAGNLTRYLAPEFETMLIGGPCGEGEEDAAFILQGMNLEPVTIRSMQRSVNPFSDIQAFSEIQKIIRVFKPDIVHTHASKAGALGRMAAYSAKVPVIVHTFHGHVFSGYFGCVHTAAYKWFERRLAAVSSAIIAISETQKKELVEKYHICREEKAVVIPLGFDLSRFSEEQGKKRTAFRSRFAVADDEIVVSIIGRIVPIKNHLLFLESIKVVMQHSDVKIKAFIVGDGPEKQKIMRQAHKMNIRTTDAKENDSTAPLCFTSWIKEIDEVTAGSDIIALTSINEGTPVSLIEAQAAGKPVVSTHVGGVADVVIPGKSALLSGADDPEMFANNLIRLTENKPMREKFGAAGRQFVADRFSYLRLAEDTAALYRRLLDQREP
jgi:glycosyltransferase involved in cell wall biosynthesis